jgi:hypothetical protein
MIRSPDELSNSIIFYAASVTTFGKNKPIKKIKKTNALKK